MTELSQTEKEMIKNFQCCGCISGGDTDCGSFVLEKADHFRCAKHHMGTMLGNFTKIALGLPKGFNREGFESIRLYEKMPNDLWNHLNIPVWALEEDGHLFVKTFCPRICKIYIDVIKGGKFADINTMADATSGKSRLNDFKTINIKEFYDEID